MSKLFSDERRNKILELLQEKKRITVKELSEKLGVSEATLRSDLNAMDKEKLLIRTHGGAMINNSTNKNENTFSEREKKNQEAKRKIGEKALELISGGQCIILDASSTALQLARLIKERQIRLTVITNGIAAAMELKENPNITLILIGGFLKVGSVGVEGTIGSSFLKQFNVDTMFTSSNGFTIEEGMTDFNVHEIELKKLMMDVSNKTIALLDDSKMNRVSITQFADVANIHTVITNSQSHEILTQLEEHGVNVLTC